MTTPNFVNDERFDGLYMNVASTAKGIEPLLDTVFSFLRRKTDFFSGPPGSGDGSQMATQKVMEILQKHADLHQADLKKKEQEKKKKELAKKKKDDQTKKESPPVVVEKEDPGVIEMGENGFDISDAPDIKASSSLSPADTKTTASTTTDPSSDTTAAGGSPEVPQTPVENNGSGNADNDDDDEDNTPPLLGNGTTVPDRYVWTQTLSEVNLITPLPQNTRGKHLTVIISKTKLTIQLKQNKKTIVASSLAKSVIVDDSFWTIEDGNKLVITLQKVDQMEWWDCVCVDDDVKIDVKKVEPENSSLSDLEGETRQTVEKMMFDQRQKALGLPSSEDQKKQDMLDKFMKQHPEMDFSKAKIS